MVNYFKNKNILITGGLGFLGSSLAHKLNEYNAHVTVIDNLNPLYGGNILNVETIMDNITIIFFPTPRMKLGKENQVFEKKSGPANPLSLYGIHKLASEKYLMMYYNNFGIPSTILRLTNPYGPRQQIKHNKYSLIGWFIRQAMEGKTIQIFGEGTQLRDYIYIDDIVTAMLKCTEADDAIGETINIGSGKSTRFCDMVKAVIDCVKNGNIEFVPWPDNYEKVETGDIAVDVSKLKNITSWQPAISLGEGVKRTFEYYKIYFNKYV